MSNDHPIDNAICGPLERIDQLIGGSLQGSAFRETLQWLEANPQHWRDCALAFLQEQAMEQDLKAMVCEDRNAVRSPNDQPASSPVPQADLDRSIANPSMKQPFVQNGEGGMHFAKFLSIAALVLLSFGIGWVIRTPGSSEFTGADLINSNSDLSHGRLVDLDTMSHRGTSIAQSRDASSGDAMMRDPDSQYSWAISDAMLRNNPNLAGNLSSRLLPIDQKIPQELLELERMGRVRINTLNSLMPVEQDNGTVLVPVQQYQIVPVVFSY